ncbi:hypothetical protein ILUMI_26701 [Ignelater luminosus]|uniref:Uncharacterized protein n=1 Tax=Ignelater luminosus TaxID=2038154 RepID=A0A8K0FXA2_IGNLU|nr:hypothetical protein ILUMI_26701 [Ignelater luminosus]
MSVRHQEELMTDNDILEISTVANTNNTLYDRKPQSKAIRVLTVLVYILCVSLAAILLSIYYIFIWDGQPTLTVIKAYHHNFTITGKSFQNKSGHTNEFPATIGTKEKNMTTYKRRDILDNVAESSISLINGNYSLNAEDLRSGLSQSLPTVEYDDSSLFTTEATEENSTWYSEFEDFNSEFDVIDKRSVFMKKLFGQREKLN